jgi:putative nucleotidyltransferase with HDIG domain
MESDSHNAKTKIERFLGEVGRGEEVLVEMMLTLVQALEERDEYTRGHSERVSVLSVAVGQELGMPAERLETLRRGALLHDIGKIGIRDELLYKPGSFTQEERARMNQHPEKGHFIVLNSHLLWDLIPMIRNHHENFDGSGYPDNLKGEEIPLEARIVSLADYFDALATARPYKKPFSKEESIQYVKSMTGKKFDPAVVDAFLKAVGPFYESYVRPLLSDEKENLSH